MIKWRTDKVPQPLLLALESKQLSAQEPIVAEGIGVVKEPVVAWPWTFGMCVNVARRIPAME